MVRRVRPPDSISADASGGADSPGAGPLALKAAGHKRQLLDAWQSALGHLVPKMEGDEVVDVQAARPDRVVLLTNRHVAYLKAAHVTRGGAAVTNYSLKWFLANETVLHVHGSDASWRIYLHSHRPVKLGRMVIKVPLKKSIRCCSSEVFQRLVFDINSHVASGGAAPQDDGAAGAGRGEARGDVADLSIARTAWHGAVVGDAESVVTDATSSVSYDDDSD